MEALQNWFSWRNAPQKLPESENVVADYDDMALLAKVALLPLFAEDHTLEFLEDKITFRATKDHSPFPQVRIDLINAALHFAGVLYAVKTNQPAKTTFEFIRKGILQYALVCEKAKIPFHSMLFVTCLDTLDLALTGSVEQIKKLVPEMHQENQLFLVKKKSWDELKLHTLANLLTINYQAFKPKQDWHIEYEQQLRGKALFKNPTVMIFKEPLKSEKKQNESNSLSNIEEKKAPEILRTESDKPSSQSTELEVCEDMTATSHIFISLNSFIDSMIFGGFLDTAKKNEKSLIKVSLSDENG